MRWVEALKVWNGRKGGAWCVPRKGTAEHAEVMKIIAGGKEAKVEAPKKFKPRVRPEVMEAFAEKKKEGKREKVKSFLKRALEKHRERKGKVEVKKEETPLEKLNRMEEEVRNGGEVSEEYFREISQVNENTPMPQLLNVYLAGQATYEANKNKLEQFRYLQPREFAYAKGASTFVKTDIETRLSDEGVKYFNKESKKFMEEEDRMGSKAYKGYIERKNKFIKQLSDNAARVKKEDKK